MSLKVLRLSDQETRLLWTLGHGTTSEVGWFEGIIPIKNEDFQNTNYSVGRFILFCTSVLTIENNDN